MMKLLAYILSFYVILLTLMPCVDLPQDNRLHRQEITAQTSTTHHDYQDICSPFCTCNCCSGPVVCTSVKIEINGAIAEPRRFSSYLPASEFNLYCSIWQPPKLG
ncbi:DUF6660 family protein [Paludibacter jiangxiensis]|uniref:Uncharacterized protein n=1 Tax=Paludibacter jiangxiensis TaxID=681398 RepID=A0A171AMK4_9BACT|nr:DUF6660 family protein [Paludibacter jiangxiensis]GAT63988.1 hypothetical protein PJIAN_4531 [Paludibacter jiangxiensis]